MAEQKLNDDITTIGSWAVRLAGDIKKLQTFNLSPVEVTKDQLIQLYILLYPFIASEYVHKDDLELWAKDIKDEIKKEFEKTNKSIESIDSALKSHSHTVQVLPNTHKGGTDSTIASTTIESADTFSTQPKAHNTGEQDYVAETSNYTKSMKHRNPRKTAKEFSPVLSVSEEFSNASKYRPFDVDESTVDTGDNEYVNNGNS